MFFDFGCGFVECYNVEMWILLTLYSIFHKNYVHKEKIIKFTDVHKWLRIMSRDYVNMLWCNNTGKEKLILKKKSIVTIDNDF